MSGVDVVSDFLFDAPSKILEYSQLLPGQLVGGFGILITLITGLAVVRWIT